MTTADDLRDLRDALDSIVHGALPRWGRPTTKTGEEAVHAAKAMYDRYVRALLAESGGRAAMAKAAKHEDNHRTHAEILTDYSEKLEQERDAARRDLGEILAVIHRDGGHYTGAHGISKSVADAHATWAAVILEREELKEKLSALREKCARICDLEFAANWSSSAMAAANAAKRCAELIRADNEETKCDD